MITRFYQQHCQLWINNICVFEYCLQGREWQSLEPCFVNLSFLWSRSCVKGKYDNHFVLNVSTEMVNGAPQEEMDGTIVPSLMSSIACINKLIFL